jgi:hypothetical protein
MERKRKRKNVNSAAGIATGYGLDSRGIRDRFPSGAIDFSSQRPDRFSDPPSLVWNGYSGALSFGLKQPGLQTDHTSPSIAEVKNGGAIPALLHMSS